MGSTAKSFLPKGILIVVFKKRKMPKMPKMTTSSTKGSKGRQHLLQGIAKVKKVLPSKLQIAVTCKAAQFALGKSPQILPLLGLGLSPEMAALINTAQCALLAAGLTMGVYSLSKFKKGMQNRKQPLLMIKGPSAPSPTTSSHPGPDLRDEESIEWMERFMFGEHPGYDHYDDDKKTEVLKEIKVKFLQQRLLLL